MGERIYQVIERDENYETALCTYVKFPTQPDLVNTLRDDLDFAFNNEMDFCKGMLMLALEGVFYLKNGTSLYTESVKFYDNE